MEGRRRRIDDDARVSENMTTKVPPSPARSANDVMTKTKKIKANR